MRLLLRAVAAALLGAIAGAVCLVAVAGWYPAVTFEMDRALPSYASGFYPLERDADETFVWTAEHAEVTLAGLDRRVPWTCDVRFRGARPSDDQQPDLMLAVDGRRAGTWRATNEFQEARVAVAVAPAKPGLVLSLTSSRIYEPPSDPRTLGVQVDRLGCEPASGVTLPPRRALGGAAAAAAALGAGFALTGITVGSAVGGAALMAIGQAFVLVRAGALYGSYPQSAVRLALVLALALVLLAMALQPRRREPLRNTARFAIVFSVGALYLQLLALLHPAKPVVDALFHAHRLDDVLAGRLYFTQLSTSATPFPYAIGLYLFSAPWVFLTANHVALLRVMVSTFEMLAGVLLYAMVVRTWGNRLAGAVAAALFSLVPLSYGIIGNANLTGAFGQAVSIITITTLTIQAGRLRRPLAFAGVAVLATLGLICHISTLVLLTSALLVLAVLYWRFGGQPLRGAGPSVVLITAVALAASTVIYWGHFGDVYRVQFDRMRAAVSSSAAPSEGTAALDTQGPAGGKDLSAMGRTTIPVGARAAQAFDQVVGSVGWPIVLLALVGAWRILLEGGRGRLDLAIAAWAIVCFVYIAASVLSPGNKAYQQDAYEFIGRVVHATLPAAVLLAARAAAWGWRAGVAVRTASVVLLSWAVVIGVRAWAGWLF
jgi:hypothetical protein